MDIEKEVSKYREHLKGKTIYCNCDDPAWSNFVRYFIMQFNNFGLKRLIATGYTVGKGALTIQTDFFDILDENIKKDNINENGYRDGPVALKSSYYIDVKSVSPQLSNYFSKNAENSLSNYELLKILKKDNLIKDLVGDGDFRSDECIKLLKQADIVITNPPFSLFREYIEQLFTYDKKFLIIGNMNAITYKEVFKHIKENRLWLGFNNNKTVEFGLSPYYEKYSRVDKNGQKYGKVPSVSWYTNLEISKRNEELILYKKYYGDDEEQAKKNRTDPNYTNPNYPKYDNYDAIEVSRVVDIPCDYFGVMGVPITFLDKYTPKQFEIVKFRKGNDDRDLVYTKKDLANKDNDIERERERERERIQSFEASSTILQNTRSLSWESIDMQKEIQNQEKECLLMEKSNLLEFSLNEFKVVALGIVGSCDFTCNKKMEILDKNGNRTGKYTMNAKGTLYRKFNPERDKVPAFRDVVSGELYSSIYARILIKRY